MEISEISATWVYGIVVHVYGNLTLRDIDVRIYGCDARYMIGAISHDSNHTVEISNIRATIESGTAN